MTTANTTKWTAVTSTSDLCKLAYDLGTQRGTDSAPHALDGILKEIAAELAKRS